MSYYVKLIIVILVVVALAEFMPEAVNAFLLFVLVSMLIVDAKTFTKAISALNLK